MKTCKTCPHYSKEYETYELEPSAMDDIGCLLRFICWTLAADYVREDEDREEGDWWKPSD